MHDVMGWLWKWDDYNPHVVRWFWAILTCPTCGRSATNLDSKASISSKRSAEHRPFTSFRQPGEFPAYFLGWGNHLQMLLFFNKYIHIYTQTYYYNMNMYIWICMCVYPYIVYDCMTVNGRFSWIGYIRAYQWGISWIFCRVRLRVAHIPKMAGENSE